MTTEQMIREFEKVLGIKPTKKPRKPQRDRKPSTPTFRKALP